MKCGEVHGHVGAARRGAAFVLVSAQFAGVDQLKNGNFLAPEVKLTKSGYKTWSRTITAKDKNMNVRVVLQRQR